MKAKILQTKETKVINQTLLNRGLLQSCIDDTSWNHQIECKEIACVAFYKRLGENRAAEIAYEKSIGR